MHLFDSGDATLMSRSPVEFFSALIRTGESGPQGVVDTVTVRRLAAYYSVVVALIILVDLVVPLGPPGKGRMLAPWLERLALGGVKGPYVVPAWVETILAMVAGFILSVPIVIVYVRTRTKEAYDESLVNIILVLPSVVTAILILVESSVALGLSLIGIVAAVRFRTNVQDSQDALYILAGVAIGFATAVHKPEVAAAASLVFVLLQLFAWRIGLAGHPIRTRPVFWGDVPIPAVHGASPKPLDLGDHAPRDIVLQVQSSERESARQVVEQILATTTKKWRPRRTPQNGTAVSLVYQARLRRAHTPDEIRDRVLREGAPIITSAKWST